MVAVTNQKATFDANTNADYNVKVTLDGSDLVQHVNIDSLPDVTVTGVATESTLSGIATSATAVETILSNANNDGFFGRVMHLLYTVVEILRAPAWVVPAPTTREQKVNCLLTTDSGLNAVTTVGTVSVVSNMTNFNNIDTRELIWVQWANAYNSGIRSKII